MFYFKKIFILLLMFIFSNEAYAERKFMQEPNPLRYSVESELDAEYRSLVNDLLSEIKKSKNDKLNKKSGKLFKTMRKDTVGNILNELEADLGGSKGNNKVILNKLSKVKEHVKNKRVSHTSNISADLELNTKDRKFIAKWKQKGKEKDIDKFMKLPFPPKVYVEVQADYRVKADNYETMVYSYSLKNSKKSEAPFMKFLIQNKFTYEYVNKIFEGKKAIAEMLSDKDRYILDLPSKNINLFTIYVYNIKSGMLYKYFSGEKTKYDLQIPSFQGGLPGIVESYIDFDDDTYEITKHMGEEGITLGISPGKGRYTMYMHYINTIGPVPSPDLVGEYNESAFMDKIISYNETAIEEGWNDKPNVIKFTRTGLEKIEKNPTKENIKGFLKALENFRKKEQILSEAYVLLKYNLEYVLDNKK